VLGVIIAGLRILGSFDIFDEAFMNLTEMQGKVGGSRSSVVSGDVELPENWDGNRN
jgi:hypothetical protein